MIKNKKYLKNNNAVSEVVGTILLIVISVGLFSGIYASFFMFDLGESTPSVYIVASIEEESLILNHCGGNDIPIDSKIFLTDESGSHINLNIESILGTEEKSDGLWNIDEKIVCDLNSVSELNFNRYESLSLQLVDSKTDSTMMIGTIQESPVSDLKLDVTTERISYTNRWWINTTLTNLGPFRAENVLVNKKLPPGFVLEYVDEEGAKSYEDSNTGMWHAGTIEVGESRYLKTKVEVTPVKPTQLAIILDGTTPVSRWNQLIHGLNQSIQNGAIPHNEEVELTVIQYGVEILSGGYVPSARLEIGPSILGDNCPTPPTQYSSVKDPICYKSVGRAIGNIQRMGGWGDVPYGDYPEMFVVPMSSGIKRATFDLTSSRSNYWNPENRQVIVFMAYNVPNCYIPIVENPVGEPRFDATTVPLNIYGNLIADYPGIEIPPLPSWCFSYNYLYAVGKSDVLKERNQMIKTLMLGQDSKMPSQDEIDIALFPEITVESRDYSFLFNSEETEWAINHIPFPEPGFSWTYDIEKRVDPGWCSIIEAYPSDAIDDSIQAMYSEIFKPQNNTMDIEIVSTKYMDPNPEDNSLVISISSLDEGSGK